MNISGQVLKQVKSFQYLGSLVNKDDKCDAKIRSRIGKAIFGKLRGILTNISLSIEIQQRMLKKYIWSVMEYGSETWNISKEMKKRLEADKMWFIRRVMRTP